MLRSALLGALALLLLGVPAAAADTVSGNLGDPADFAMSYRITGGTFTLKPGSTNEYTGTWTEGQPITLTGEMTVTRRAGVVSAVTMSAHIGSTATWQWPAGATSQDVSGATVTQSFALSYTPADKDRQFGQVNGGAYIRVCGGVCATQYVGFDLKVAAQAPAPTPTSPPTARALPLGQIMRAGQQYQLSYWIKDASGQAYAYADLFDGGAPIGHAESAGLLTADGAILHINTTPGRSRHGPLFFCVWAKNAAGLSSQRAPRTSCAWLPLLVSIKLVSNHCGGAGWDSIVAVENYFGNTSSYYDPATGRRYTVRFSAACDLHDAGYAGATVRDRLHPTRTQPLGRITDFRLWSRREVDDKFQADMQLLCRRYIPRAAATARRKCVEGRVRYRLVRAVGDQFFDADLMTAGTQSTGARDNS